MVDVSSQNNSISINVSSSGNSASINATPDMAMFYSEKSREWAISNRIVDGVDYSSKYYAGKANESALNAKSFAQSAQDSYKQFQNSVDGALSNIDSSVQGGIEDINNTKTDIITDIEFVADGEKKEIEELIDNGKEELKESIGDVKVLTTLEIGDIGIAPLGIDETKGKRRYLNGQLIIQDQYVEFTKKVKSAVALYPSLTCTESEWQTTATMTVGGQVGKFVVDDDAGTIRLPKIIMPIQGLTDLSKLGEIVEAGLPNITGYLGRTLGGAKTAPFYTENSYQVNGGTGASLQDVFMDLSLSNSIYGNSNTVQQEQIQYPYFIQVATGAETEDNVINEIELNNPYSLFDNKYTEAPLYNISWLLANGSYNGSNAVHPSAYQALLVENNAEVEIGSTVTLPIGTEYTKRGLSVKLSTDSDITDYDFRINTADETFMLPIKVKLASGKAVVGNGMTLGLTNGSKYFGVYGGGSSGIMNQLVGDETLYGDVIGTARSSSSPGLDNNALGLTSDAEKSGIETSDSDLYLYFYVGETVQNANLINAGRIEEKLADLIPNNSNLITNYCTPDYANGISVAYASGINYTCPADGVFSVQLYIGGAAALGTVSVNGSAALRANSGSSTVPTTIQGQIIVSKGDVITATKPIDAGSSYNSAYFYPMKGAN